MKRIMQGYWVSEERNESIRRNHFSPERKLFQWIKSLFKGKTEEKPEPKE